jgi:hypothetical protein
MSDFFTPLNIVLALWGTTMIILVRYLYQIVSRLHEISYTLKLINLCTKRVEAPQSTLEKGAQSV